MGEGYDSRAGLEGKSSLGGLLEVKVSRLFEGKLSRLLGGKLSLEDGKDSWDGLEKSFAGDGTVGRNGM